MWACTKRMRNIFLVHLPYLYFNLFFGAKNSPNAVVRSFERYFLCWVSFSTTKGNPNNQSSIMLDDVGYWEYARWYRVIPWSQSIEGDQFWP